MLVIFSDVLKERNKYINGINNINQILKHTFDSFILDTKGTVFQSCAKIDFGYHMAFTDLHNYLCVPEGKMLKISSTTLFTAIKDRKKELRGYGIAEDVVHFITDTGERVIIGKLLSDKEMVDMIEENKRFINLYKSFTKCTDIDEYEKESLVDKNVVTKEHKGYKMILTHKIIPQIKKSESVDISIHEDSENMFISVFDVRHKSDIHTIHFYKFLKF